MKKDPNVEEQLEPLEMVVTPEGKQMCDELNQHFLAKIWAGFDQDEGERRRKGKRGNVPSETENLSGKI